MLIIFINYMDKNYFHSLSLLNRVKIYVSKKYKYVAYNKEIIKKLWIKLNYKSL